MDVHVVVPDEASQQRAAEALAEACGGDLPRFKRAVAADKPIPLRAVSLLEADRARQALEASQVQVSLVPVAVSMRPTTAPKKGLSSISRGKAVGATVGLVGLVLLLRWVTLDGPASRPPPLPVNDAAALPRLDEAARKAQQQREAREAEREALLAALGQHGLLTNAELRTTVEEVAPGKKKRRRKKRRRKTRRVKTLRAQVMMTGSDAGVREQRFRLGSCRWKASAVQTVPVDPAAWADQQTPLAELGRAMTLQQGIYELPLDGCSDAKRGSRLRLSKAAEGYRVTKVR